MTQTDLATRAGISDRHLSFIETGRTQPSIEVVGYLAGALRLPISELGAIREAAGHLAVAPTEELPDSLLAEMSALLEAMAPHPALIHDRYGTVHGMNRPILEFLDIAGLGDLVGRSGGHRIIDLAIERYPGLAGFREVFRKRVFGELVRGPEVDHNMLALYEALGEPSSDHRAQTGPLLYLVTLKRRGIDFNFRAFTSTLGVPTNRSLRGLRLFAFLPADAHTRLALETMEVAPFDGIATRN